ncbi:hypothetical protein [Neptunomonas japonica]|uniref:Uncharacterized protein n=1 Tax=Neptunomonas japonica JAMM 1380 TaxID=1441457 RepID=A0A7R6PS42_9GAMM|nr:hypothetical protein [Neptunomonas japonica]BBB29390.1 conserved hypothetical protein [Neptunomonas japonica JAMM 1380]
MRFIKGIMATSLILFSTVSYAGIFSDDLTRCLTEKTTSSDKTLIMKWMYAGMSKHPEISSSSTITDKQAQHLNQRTAELVVDLMTKRCTATAKKALKYEDKAAFVAAFQVLGKVAMKELMRNKEVNAHIGGIGKYISKEALETLKPTN